MNTASGNPVGIISVTSNIESRYTQVKDIRVIFISSSIFVIILAIVITVLISQGITRPIAEMKQQTGSRLQKETIRVKWWFTETMSLDNLGQAINDLCED